MKFLSSKKKFIRFFICLIIIIINIPTFAALDAPEEQIHFMALADIHFDPFISCRRVTPCPLIQKLRRAGVSSWSEILTKYDDEIPNYGKDTNYPLLTSALHAAKNAAKDNQVKFVLVIGDFLGHDFRRLYKKYSKDKSAQGYQEFVNKVMQFLTLEISQTFPTLDVYPVIGNNDSYHYDYFSQPQGAFFKDSAKIFASLFKNNNDRMTLLKEFSNAGYYAINLQNKENVSEAPNLRLIVLNSVLFSIHAKGRDVDNAADKELDWLQHQLQLAESNQQKVILVMHIPMTVDVYISPRLRLFTLLNLWEKQYITRFKTQIERFAPNIAIILGAHLHSDWFQYIETSKNEIPTMGASAISPYFKNNPSFKIYSFSTKSLEFSPLATYYYSLHERRNWTLRGF